MMYESEMRKCELHWLTDKKLQEALQWFKNECANEDTLENKNEVNDFESTFDITKILIR